LDPSSALRVLLIAYMVGSEKGVCALGPDKVSHQ
jgi:hypothetical protein